MFKIVGRFRAGPIMLLNFKFTLKLKPLKAIVPPPHPWTGPSLTLLFCSVRTFRLDETYQKVIANSAEISVLIFKIF